MPRLIQNIKLNLRLLRLRLYVCGLGNRDAQLRSQVCDLTLQRSNGGRPTSQFDHVFGAGVLQGLMRLFYAAPVAGKLRA